MPSGETQAALLPPGFDPSDLLFRLTTTMPEDFDLELAAKNHTSLHLENLVTGAQETVAEVGWVDFRSLFDQSEYDRLDNLDVEQSHVFAFYRSLELVDSCLYLSSVYVEPAWRGLGLAEYVLRAMPIAMRRYHDEVVVLPWSNDDPAATKRLQKLVRRAGYKRWAGNQARPMKLYWTDTHGDLDALRLQEEHVTRLLAKRIPDATPAAGT